MLPSQVCHSLRQQSIVPDRHKPTQRLIIHFDVVPHFLRWWNGNRQLPPIPDPQDRHNRRNRARHRCCCRNKPAEVHLVGVDLRQYSQKAVANGRISFLDFHMTNGKRPRWALRSPLARLALVGCICSRRRRWGRAAIIQEERLTEDLICLYLVEKKTRRSSLAITSL